jgi:hypothetical protein
MQAVLSAPQSVDAVTAATVNRSCTFSTPVVTSTTARVKWSGGHSGGTATFSYGTDPSKLTTRAVTAAERSAATITLTGLIPKTTYTVQYLVSSSGETPYEASGTLTTLTGTGVARQELASPGKVMPLEFFDHSVILGVAPTPGDLLTALDVNGRLVMSYYIASNESSINLPAKLRGIVFLKYSRNGTVLDTRKVIAVK